MSNVCGSCQKNNTSLQCGICAVASCKYCAHILEHDAFLFWPEVPADLQHGVYCNSCYDTRVAAELENYNECLDRARNVDCFFRTQGKESRLIKRVEKPVTIKECFDKDELLMRLAFIAAKRNYNALVDVDLVSEKVGVGSYQKLKWKGTATPANATARSVVHDKSILHNPN